MEATARRQAHAIIRILPSHPQHEIARQPDDERAAPLVSLELKGSKPAAFAFMNALEIVDISNNLGDAKSR
jgi:O-succinylhomoserine sulfhydrylase